MTISGPINYGDNSQSTPSEKKTGKPTTKKEPDLIKNAMKQTGEVTQALAMPAPDAETRRQSEASKALAESAKSNIRKKRTIPEAAQEKAIARIKREQKNQPVQLQRVPNSYNPVAKVPAPLYLPRAAIAQYPKLAAQLKLSQVPTLYRKDEVASNIRMALERAGSESERKSLLSALHFLDENYLSESKLEKLLPAENRKALLANLTAYVCSHDILPLHEAKIEAQEVLSKIARQSRMPKGSSARITQGEDIAFSEPSSFAAKLGPENRRELLMQRLAAPLSLSELLVPKAEESLPDANIEGQSLAVGAIVSKWVEEGQPLPFDEISKMCQITKDLEILAFKQERRIQELQRSGQTIDADPENMKFIAEAQKLRAKLEKADQLFLDKLGIKPPAPNDPLFIEKLKLFQQQKWDFASSIQGQALLDCLFGSFDSHEGQYMVHQGRVVCLDFARFLAPSSSFQEKDKLYFVFRSFLIDHPACAQPLSAELREKILSWDPGEIESKWEREMGDPSAIGQLTDRFREWDREIDQLNKEYQNLNKLADQESSLRAICSKMCEKLEIPFDDKIPIVKFAHKLREAASAKFQDLDFSEAFNNKEGVDLLKACEKAPPIAAEEKKLRDQLENISDKHGFPYEDAENIDQAVGSLLSRMNPAARQTLAMKQYDKIHPKSFEAFHKRMHALQEHIRTNPEASIRSCFDCMYPEEEPFMHVMRRVLRHPGRDITQTGVKYEPMRDLQSILELAEKEKIATTEEIEAMQNRLQTLRESACSASEVLFAMPKD